MTPTHHHRTFGRQTAPHTIIIARGEKVRHFTVRSRTIVLCGALAALALLGSLGTAGTLLLLDRHDILVGNGTDDELLQHAYETRIAALRTQLDRAVSRQMLDKQSVETKVSVLLDQQMELAARYDKLKPLLDRARDNGLLSNLPVPRPNPNAAPAAEAPVSSLVPAAAGDASDGDAVPAPLAFSSDDAGGARAAGLARFRLIDKSVAPASGSEKAPEAPKPAGTVSAALIQEIGRSIDSVENRQIESLDVLSSTARERADGIASALRVEGIAFAMPQAAALEKNTGGPLVDVPPELRFEASYDDLDAALDHLQAVRQSTNQIPLGTPVAAVGVSSTFGVRPDPFLGRAAMHTGIDLVAESGTAVTAAAPGKVVSAGPNGGYGLMVEVDHGRGLVTRYAHLSSILVEVGASIVPGDKIGLVGSTGRSTGPHLHYEVRRVGEAVDPARYLRAGRKIRALI